MILKVLFHMVVFVSGILVACLGIADLMWRAGATDPERIMHPVLNDNMSVTATAILLVFTGFCCGMRGLQKIFDVMTNNK